MAMRTLSTLTDQHEAAIEGRKNLFSKRDALRNNIPVPRTTSGYRCLAKINLPIGQKWPIVIILI
jgi:hypothetical protein